MAFEFSKGRLVSEQEIRDVLFKERKPGFLQRIKGRVEERAEKVQDIADVTRIPGREGGRQTFAEGIFQTAGQAVAGVGDIGLEAVRTVGGALLPDIVGQTAQSVGRTLMETDLGRLGLQALSTGAQQWEEFSESNPRASRDISAFLNIVEILPIGKAVGVAAKGTKIGITPGRFAVSKTSESIRGLNSKINPANKTAAIENLKGAYLKSFVDDKASINKKLGEIALKARRRGGPDSADGLVRELAEEGYLPIVEGKLANMQGVIDDLANRRAFLAKAVDKFLEPVQVKTPIQSLRDRVKLSIDENISADERSLKQAEKILDNFENKFGKQLTGIQINTIRKEMNSATKAFNKEAFVDDAQNAVARGTREIIDELVPQKEVRIINAEIGRLFRLNDTAKVFHFKAIAVDEITAALGRFLGTVTLGGPLLGVAGILTGAAGFATGGGLVIAGIAAQIGGNRIAQIVRNLRFNPKLRAIIGESLRNEEKLLNSLIKEATPQNAKLLREIKDGTI